MLLIIQKNLEDDLWILKMIITKTSLKISDQWDDHLDEDRLIEKEIEIVISTTSETGNEIDPSGKVTYTTQIQFYSSMLTR